MTTIFVYYSKSADAKPGKGSGEYLNINDNYEELSKIKNWRKMLSNFYIAPFVLDDNTWNSVEHFFHAIKFRNGKKPSSNYDYYKTFSLYGDRPWSTDPIFAKQAGKAGRISETTGKIYDKKIGEYKIPKDVTLRPDFYTNKIDKKLESLAFLAKFTQNEELKKMLLATGNAELWHYVGRGSPNLFMKNLMKVRECIRKYDNVYNLKEMSKFSTEMVTKVLNDY
jgi:predicted NAD-dependent protein-ADP-ribosyltransferase YbiA (DUF1768 family)